MTEKKIAIVTGISSGIGKATALKLVEEGFIVYGGARRVDRLQELKAQGVRVQALDVTDESSNRALIDRVLNEEKRIDILVNNAGYGEYGALEEVTTEAAKKQFDVNLFGLANITQLVLPTMRAQQSGRIINISSIGGRIYSPAGGWYHASKHALEVYSDVLRMETKPFGIKVIVVEPSGTKTEWGTIASDNAKAATSQGSAYYEMIHTYSNFENAAGSSDSAEDIASLIYKAISDNKPRYRYLPSFSAKMITFIARKFPVSWYDRFITAMMKRLLRNK